MIPPPPAERRGGGIARHVSGERWDGGHGGLVVLGLVVVVQAVDGVWSSWSNAETSTFFKDASDVDFLCLRVYLQGSFGA